MLVEDGGAYGAHLPRVDVPVAPLSKQTAAYKRTKKMV